MAATVRFRLSARPRLTTITETKVFDDDTKKAIDVELTKFKKTFRTSGGQLLETLQAPTKVEDEDIQQAKIVTEKRKK